MSDFLTDFLALCLQEQGIKNPQPLAEKFARDVRKAKRDELIYELSGKVPTADIAVRFDMSQRRAEQIINAQLLLRRTG